MGILLFVKGWGGVDYSACRMEGGEEDRGKERKEGGGGLGKMRKKGEDWGLAYSGVAGH